MSGPLLMSEAARAGAAASERSSAVLEATLDLMRRRTRAVAEFWEASGRTFAPADRLEIQLGYWKQMADDYTATLSRALAPWTVEAASPPVPEFAPPTAMTPSPSAPAPSVGEPMPAAAPAEPATFAEPEAARAKPAKPLRREPTASPDEERFGVPDGRDMNPRS